GTTARDRERPGGTTGESIPRLHRAGRNSNRDGGAPARREVDRWTADSAGGPIHDRSGAWPPSVGGMRIGAAKRSEAGYGNAPHAARLLRSAPRVGSRAGEQLRDLRGGFENEIGAERGEGGRGGEAPGHGAERDADGAGGVGVADLVADVERVRGWGVEAAEHALQAALLAEQGCAALVAADQGGVLRAEHAAHVVVRVGGHDGEGDAGVREAPEHVFDAGEERDFVEVRGGEAADVGGDSGELADRDPELGEEFPGPEAAQRIDLVIRDPPESEPVGQVVDLAEEPAEGVRQGPVEIEDHEAVLHLSILSRDALPGGAAPRGRSFQAGLRRGRPGRNVAFYRRAPRPVPAVVGGSRAGRSVSRWRSEPATSPVTLPGERRAP